MIMFQMYEEFSQPNFKKDILNPNRLKLTSKKFLTGLIPYNWNEKVYEYSDKFIIEVSLKEDTSRSLEMYLLDIIRKEFGNNIINNMAQNSEYQKIIRVELKKQNYIS